MAHFRGTVEGNRGEASRLGSKDSGLHVTANGWHVGTRVILRNNSEDEDTVTIYLTTGSGGYGKEVCLGTFSHIDLEDQPALLKAVQKAVLGV